MQQLPLDLTPHPFCILSLPSMSLYVSVCLSVCLYVCLSPLSMCDSSSLPISDDHG